ncbi:MAG TPA: hypothetical protein VFL80_07780 [Thermoanaerobaculia bacterium]|nr:hypothetical protein [Thermoanaerobaculia bacterium]
MTLDVRQLVLDTAQRGELHHAAILHGEATQLLIDLAMALAKTLNCLHHTTGDDCSACDRIARRIHPDVHLIEVTGERKLIAVEQIREVVAAASLRPYEGRKKVFIIMSAEAVSAGGSNALLKTLEEPPRDTHFLLLTRSPDMLLPTIRSRCQAIHVGGEREVDLAFRADIVESLGSFVSGGDGAALLALAARVAAEEDAKEALASLAAVMRDAAAGTEAELAVISGAVPREKLLAAATSLLSAVEALRVNADVRLLAERALAELVT